MRHERWSNKWFNATAGKAGRALTWRWVSYLRWLYSGDTVAA